MSVNRNGTSATLLVAETLRQIRERHQLSARAAQMLACILLNQPAVDAADVGVLELHFGPNGVSGHLNQRLILDYRDHS